jgi:thiamine pyrophosphate-dependent acetolactate synthase large subunit-like protein
MGEGNLELVLELAAVGIRFVACRHESAAVAAADGYARATGSIGVSTVTQGPGLTNTLTALTAASRYKSRVLLIAADTPTSHREHPQDADQAAFVAPTGATFLKMHSAGHIRDITAEALLLARSSTVVLDAPGDVLRSEVAPADRRLPSAASPSPNSVEIPDLSSALRLLADAQTPVLLAGRGAVEAGAIPAIAGLAERSGSLLATTLQAKGTFGEDPFCVGIAGGYSSTLAAELLSGADLVIAFGASLNSWQTRSGQLFAKAQVIRVDCDPRSIGGGLPVSVSVVGDAATVANAMLDAWNVGPASGKWRSPSVAERIAAFDPRAEYEDHSDPGALDPRTVAILLDRALPRDRTLVVDGGHFSGYPAMLMGAPDPKGFIYALEFGATGLGFGSAIGAAVGRPDRTTVLTIGDGGLLMTLSELDTAVRERLPMVVAVFNDRAYGSEVHHLRIRGLDPAAAQFATPSLDLVAQAIGARGVRVSTIAELSNLNISAAELDGPLLLDILIDGNVLADWFRDFARRAAPKGEWT